MKNSKTCNQPCNLACDLACLQPSMQADVQPEHQARRKVSCEFGLSAQQINVLGILVRIGEKVTPYYKIAEMITKEFHSAATGNSIRGTITRLTQRGFLTHKQAKEGTINGVRFMLIESKVCKHLIAAETMRPDVQPGMQHDVRHGENFASFLNKIDRKNLSISSKADIDHKQLLDVLSEGDIKFYWPKLAAAGFGTVQIRQVIKRQEQVGNGVENVIMGLTHAEWELENDEMRDKSSNPVDSPLNWVYSSLAKHGYYRRPKNYISPAEQAELDQKAVVEQEQQAIETRKEAQVKVWLTNLTPSEKENVLELTGGAYCGIPGNNRLRNYFWENVWPTIRPDLKEIL